MSISKKHWTSSQVYDKINRYTFLDRNSILLDGTKRGKSVKEIPFPSENVGLYGVRFAPDSTKLIASFGTGTIHVFDVDLGTSLYCVKKETGPAYPVMTIRCGLENWNIFFAAGICGNVYMCKFAANSSHVFAHERHNEINAMDLDPNIDILATGGKDGSIRLYDVKTGKIVSKLHRARQIDEPTDTSFHVKRIFAIKFDVTRPHTFLSGGWDDCVKIWDTRNRDGCVGTISGPHICGDALDINDNVVLTGQWTAENALQLWDLSTRKLITNVVPTNRVQSLDGEFLYCCQFFKCVGYPDTVVAGGSGTGHLDIINIPDERLTYTFKVNKLIQALDATADFKIAYGGMEHLIRVANMTERSS